MIYSLSDIRRILREELSQTAVKQAVLFGSYAKGCPREGSDLDMVVDMGGQHGHFAFWGVYEQLQNAFSVPVELFEKCEITPGMEAEREIRQTGVIVYDRERPELA